MAASEDKELKCVVVDDAEFTPLVAQKPAELSTRNKSGDGACTIRIPPPPRSNAENALHRLQEEHEQEVRFSDGAKTKRSKSPHPGENGDKRSKGPTKGHSSMTAADRTGERRGEETNYSRGISTVSGATYSSTRRSSLRGENMWTAEADDDRFDASENSPYVQQLVTMPSQEDGMHPKNLSLSERLPEWMWLLLTTSLGVRLGPQKKPIVATCLHVLTLTAAFGFSMAGGWYKMRDIYSEYTRTTALMGLVSCIIGLCWVCLGIYAHKLAGRLMMNDHLVDSVRLHSKTFLKISTAALAMLLSLGGMGINLYNAYFDFGIDKCEKAGTHWVVCRVAFIFHVIFSFLCLTWNLIVSFILFSLCRTHTVRIRRFCRELAVDGKRCELFWVENLSEIAAQRHQELFPGPDLVYLPDDCSSVCGDTYDLLREEVCFPKNAQGAGRGLARGAVGERGGRRGNRTDFSSLQEPSRLTRPTAENPSGWHPFQNSAGGGVSQRTEGVAGDPLVPKVPSSSSIENLEALVARKKVEKWRERSRLYAGIGSFPDYGSVNGTAGDLSQTFRGERSNHLLVPESAVGFMPGSSRSASPIPNLFRDPDGVGMRRRPLGAKSDTSSVHPGEDKAVVSSDLPVMSNADLYLSHWKLNKRLMMTSRYLQRWMVSWIFFIFLWCTDFVIVWTSNPATMLGISEFTIPLALLLLLTSAYAEVNGEGQRLIKNICPTEKRLQVIQYFAMMPLQLLVFSFAITYNALMGIILAFSVAFASRIILDEVVK